MFILAHDNDDGTTAVLSTLPVGQKMVCGCVHRKSPSVHTLSEKSCYCNYDQCKGVSYDTWVRYFMKEENVKEDEVKEAILALRKIDATLSFYIDYSFDTWNETISLRLCGANSSIRKPDRNR